ncbi:MAG: FCD domain-containing protein [Mesorhizobium sp.]|uniref:FadR/GntR family transcriptional regulator n=1 Tax=Mesorhizobium TaxID=68287 RepID=UPI000FE8F953|nr:MULTISPECIES: FCD domain-containing protein [Mesorhizobium]MCF6111547.1 FCD domain-containing protein [Mesorhizobium muleiense]RWO91358.1 MAG: FCD domain-containing protein [Mesorhizobium sp.]RWQ51173.1 MAG: FCD domain-containing protein [Mesorhizobium sp.]TIL75818.1 MAG: FCD domain-containing protein [Mesorhizobium sp.]TIL86391.1 MAG: FCD domain-containing protein [Mesorhizobium sp.]
MSDIFSRIEHSRTADEVVQQIESLILEGVLRTGDRLPGERELARRFEVSRPILRDALKALEGRGLLTTRPGGGTHVADVIGQLFTKPVTDLISMHRKAATDYLEYRREIEAVAAEYAARRATSDDRALLDRIMARMDEAHRTGNFDDEAEIDVEFHHAICECAHNIILLHTLRSCYRLLSEGVFQNRLLVFNVPGAREALLSQHRAIYAAVKAGDPAAARQAAMDHITHVERTMAEAERSGDWQRVSRLRLMQRSEAGDSEPARKRS